MTVISSHQDDGINKLKLWVLLPLCIVIFSALVNVTITARVSDVGSQIYALDLKREALEKKNDQMELTLAQKLSIQTIADAAKQEGYIPRNSVVELNTTTSIAKGN